MEGLQLENLREIRIHSDAPITRSLYASNTLRLSRYSFVSYLPRSLFEQFKRISNIWFLIVSIFQLIPYNLNPTDSWTTIVPLSILLLISLSTDAFTDYKLNKKIRKINSGTYDCWNGNDFAPVKSKNILVGQFIKVKENQTVPADMILIATKNQESAFLDMTRLIGVASLKEKRPIEHLSKKIQVSEGEFFGIGALKGDVKVTEPTLSYLSFYGTIKEENNPNAMTLTTTNLLFSGGKLKGVQSVLGFVVYCGIESRMMLNTNSFKRKSSSRMEEMVNTWVLYILGLLALFVLGSVLGFYYFNNYTTNDYQILEPVITFILLYNNIIPISLFMVIDIIRILQNKIFTYYNVGFEFNNHVVNENLGQIDYLVMDKTVTLTEKQLVVKSLIVNTKVYEEDFEDMEKDQPVDRPNQPTDGLLNTSYRVQEHKFGNFSTFNSYLHQETSHNSGHSFVKCMALCNNLTQFNDEFLGSNHEIAFVRTAKTFGYSIKKGNKLVDLTWNENVTSFKEIASVKYSKKKKRSRILLKNFAGGGILCVKGKPETMIPLLNITPIQSEELSTLIEEQESKGQRCTIFSYKHFTNNEIEEFEGKVKRIRQSLINYEGRIEAMFRDLEKNLKYVGVAGISNKLLINTTETLGKLKKAGIKLWMVSSDSTTSSFNTAMESGIICNSSNLLEMTNIGNQLSCSKLMIKGIRRLILDKMNELVIRKSLSSLFRRRKQLNQNIPNHLNPDNRERGQDSEEEREEEEEEVEDADVNSKRRKNISILRKMTRMDTEIDSILNSPFESFDLNYSLLIDRATFKIAIEDQNLRKMLVCLLVCAKSVCFTKLMPKDKGNAIKLLKENVRFKPLVAAVGSGEGDINILQCADVGIGIKSNEESLSENYSDIIISKFTDIDRLVLLQGHYNYIRMSKSIFLFLYKNCFLTIALLAFTFLSSFSGTSIFNASLLVGYNIFFTTLPILVIGVFDKDVDSEKILKQPQIYVTGIENKNFNWKKLMSYLGISLVHGVILIILTYVALPYVTSTNGMSENFILLGTLIYITIIVTVLIQIYIETYCFSLLYYLSILFSLIFLLIFIVITSNTSFPDTELIGIGEMLQSSCFSLVSIFFSSLICIVPTYFLITYLAIFNPQVEHMLSSNQILLDPILKKLICFEKRLSSIYKASGNWNNQLQGEKFELNKFTLQFKIPHIEFKFSLDFIKKHLFMFKFVIGLLLLLLVLWTIFGVTLLTVDWGYTLARIILLALFSVFLFMLWTNHFKSHYVFYISIVILVTIVSKIGLELGFGKTSLLVTSLISSVTFLVLNVHWVIICLLNVLNVVLFLISISIEYTTISPLDSPGLMILSTFILILAITITSGIVGYNCYLSERTEHILISKTQSEANLAKSMLKMLLPKFVINRVKDGVRYIAENQDDVSVLFCDICDFDDICKEYKPHELTSFLHKVFSNFDNLCQKNGVTKIETVGKTYMACAGLRDSDKEIPANLRNLPHALRAIELAFAIIQEVKDIQLKNGDFLHVKIGINSGPVTAGVVGYHKPQFSLVGDTVNTASRMCSTLDSPNQIQINETTFQLVKEISHLNFFAKTVFAKGKGDIPVYIVNEKENGDSDIAGGFESIGRRLPGCEHFSSNSIVNEFLTDIPKREVTRDSKTWRLELLKKTDKMLIEPNPDFWFLWLKKEDKETAFRMAQLDKNYYVVFLSLLISLIAFALLLIIDIILYQTTDTFKTPSSIIGKSVVLGINIVLVVMHHKIYKKFIYSMVLLTYLSVMHLISMMEISFEANLPRDLIGLQVIYTILLVCHCSEAPLIGILTLNISILIPWIALATYSNSSTIHLTNIILAAGFYLINIKAIYSREKHDRMNHNLTFLADKEIAASESLLLQMMPAHVVEILQRGKTKTDRLHNQTLIFADIVGFTNWSATKTSNEIVEMLSNLFTRFDKLCVEFDIYKVHTIGDCYVVMGDVGKKHRRPAKECINVMKMAYRMIEVINEENVKHGSQLNMRIGVHTGEVIAGTIGTRLIHYDIWGSDVMIANKMESNGAIGKVKVSEDTKEMIESKHPYGFTFEESDVLDLPAIGIKKRTFYAGCHDINALVDNE